MSSFSVLVYIFVLTIGRSFLSFWHCINFSSKGGIYIYIYIERVNCFFWLVGIVLVEESLAGTRRCIVVAHTYVGISQPVPTLRSLGNFYRGEKIVVLQYSRGSALLIVKRHFFAGGLFSYFLFFIVVWSVEVDCKVRAVRYDYCERIEYMDLSSWIWRVNPPGPRDRGYAPVCERQTRTCTVVESSVGCGKFLTMLLCCNNKNLTVNRTFEFFI